MYRVLVLFLVVICVGGEHLQVGTSANNELVFTEDVKLSAVPLKTRTKNVFYNGNNSKPIKGIWVIDMDNSKAKVTVTSGGVGSTFANIKIKSERGEGLNFQVQIFV